MRTLVLLFACAMLCGVTSTCSTTPEGSPLVCPDLPDDPAEAAAVAVRWLRIVEAVVATLPPETQARIVKEIERAIPPEVASVETVAALIEAILLAIAEPVPG